MTRLVTVVQDFRLGGFASIVPVPDFKTTFPGFDSDAPYELAVTHTILNMAHLASEHGQVVKFWFENSTRKQEASTSRTYDRLKRLNCWNNRDLLQGMSFGPKALRPLQAADLVAREAFKHVYNFVSAPYDDP